VVAITASQSPLAKKADVTLIVDHVEDIATHLPMVSRILHLLVIDILAVGVAMRRNPDSIAALSGGEDDEGKAARSTTAATPGISTASPLARLTSHSR
jgi:glucokinase